MTEAEKEREFEGRLSAMVAKKLCGTADDIAAAIERLTDALGLAIAVSCRGEITRADETIIGVEGYLAECIAHHAKLARFMAIARGDHLNHRDMRDD